MKFKVNKPDSRAQSVQSTQPEIGKDSKTADEVSKVEDRYQTKQTEQKKNFKRPIPIINHQREQKFHLETVTI